MGILVEARVRQFKRAQRERSDSYLCSENIVKFL